MLNLFKSKKDPGRSPPKPSSTRKGQASASNRAGVRTQRGEISSWFGKNNSKNNKDVQIRSISASSPALTNNNNNNENKKSNKRPLTIVGEGNVTLRRGQQSSKIDQTTPDDLSRSSSITNLNVDQKPKGAKPKKSDSKDKLDKLAKNERKLAKNNNKESSENSDFSPEDFDSLAKQLQQMANEKSLLALQLGEKNGQLAKLEQEIAQLKIMQEESNDKIEKLIDENTILRNRLRDVAHSPLSDSEKQQLLYEGRHHSSAPASIATNLLDDGGDITACPTPEWDKHSSSSVSEVSVACLQDKINQMQETHYSTNEELQATLQELTELQKQLTELQQENVRLNEEKNLMFESLCRQTERLNDSRSEVESLKQLLYKDDGQFETAAEREQKLLDLLKSAQEERETLLVKQEQLGNDLEDSRSANLIHNDEIAQLTERVKTLESTLDAKHAEHKLLDQELALAKDQSSGRQIEINRLKDLLENAKAKIGELEQDRTLSDKSELDELLDNARKEKDALESEVAHLKEQLALSKNESEKLREQVSILQEECKVTRNNAKTTQSDLEYKLEKAQSDKVALTEQLSQFQDAVNELQVQAQCQLDDKRQLSTVLSETQRNLNESERRIVELESELAELKRVKREQEEEWEKFQNDLLTSVRVANDFKTEAQQDLQKLIMENKQGRERIKQLEAQVEKLEGTRKKKLSNEEALLASLDRRYKEIEDLDDELLTEEQKAVKNLKKHYDQDLPRQKPKAKKPKDELAISKPSLESVISNPKLEFYVKNPKLQNVEELNDNFSLTSLEDIESCIDEVKSESGLTTFDKEEQETLRRKSLSDLPKKNNKAKSNLCRVNNTENLAELSKNKKKKRKKSSVNLSTLETICNEIDPNTPEEELSKEQRLALRLRQVLQNEERKTALKKNSKLKRKKGLISRPTPESVEKNEKLRQIINDPIVKSIKTDSKIVKRNKNILTGSQRYSMPVSLSKKQDFSKTPKKSTSYNDITFKFQPPNMYGEEQNEERRLDFESVLPPEEFRDPGSSMVGGRSVFDTFQNANNTFKKEHNILDYDADVEEESRRIGKKLEEKDPKVNGIEKKFGEEFSYFEDEDDVEEHKVKIEEETDEDQNIYDEDYPQIVEEIEEVEVDARKNKKLPKLIPGTLKYDYLEEHLDVHRKINEEMEDICFGDTHKQKIVNPLAESSKYDYSVVDIDANQKIDELKDQDEEREDFFIDDGQNEDIAEATNDSVTRRLKKVEDILDEESDLDDEERNARRGIRQRYSHVVEEIKEIFKESNDDENLDKYELKKLEDVVDSIIKEGGSTYMAVPVVISESEGEWKSGDEDVDLKKEEISKNSSESEGDCEKIDIEEAIERSLDDSVLRTNKQIDEDIEGKLIEVTDNDTNIFFKTEDEYIVEEPNEETEQKSSEDLKTVHENGLRITEVEETYSRKSTLVLQDESISLHLTDDLKNSENKDYIENTEMVKRVSITRVEEAAMEELKVMKDSNKGKMTDEEIEDGRIERRESLSNLVQDFVITDLILSSSENKNEDIEDGYRDRKLNMTNKDVKNEDEDNDKFEEDKEEFEDMPAKVATVGKSVDVKEMKRIEEDKNEDIEDEKREKLIIHKNQNGDISLKNNNEDNDKFEEEENEEIEDFLVKITANAGSVDVKEIKTKDGNRNFEEERKTEESPSKLSKEELELLEKYSPRNLSEINSEDLALVDRIKKQNHIEGGTKHVFPRILSPTKLNQRPSYEPVYANFYISANRHSVDDQRPIMGKKPVALPRNNSLGNTNEPIYRDFSGQIRKTRFSITYERKKGDSFKEENQEKKKKVKDLKEMFEKK